MVYVAIGDWARRLEDLIIFISCQQRDGVCTVQGQEGSSPLSGLGVLTILGDCRDGGVVGVRWRGVCLKLDQPGFQLLVQCRLLFDNILQGGDGRLHDVYLVLEGGDLGALPGFNERDHGGVLFTTTIDKSGRQMILSSHNT